MPKEIIKLEFSEEDLKKLIACKYQLDAKTIQIKINPYNEMMQTGIVNGVLETKTLPIKFSLIVEGEKKKYQTQWN